MSAQPSPFATEQIRIALADANRIYKQRAKLTANDKHRLTCAVTVITQNAAECDEPLRSALLESAEFYGKRVHA